MNKSLAHAVIAQATKDIQRGESNKDLTSAVYFLYNEKNGALEFWCQFLDYSERTIREKLPSPLDLFKAWYQGREFKKELYYLFYQGKVWRITGVWLTMGRDNNWAIADTLRAGGICHG